MLAGDHFYAPPRGRCLSDGGKHWPGIGARNQPMHEHLGSTELTKGKHSMDKQRTDKHRNRSPKPTAPGARQSRPRTYEQPALDDIPLNPKRCGYVLQLILRQHNWQHSSKPKGVSNKTMAERTRKNPKIAFELSSAIEEVLGRDKVTGVRLKNLKTGESREKSAAGVSPCPKLKTFCVPSRASAMRSSWHCRPSPGAGSRVSRPCASRGPRRAPRV